MALADNPDLKRMIEDARDDADRKAREREPRGKPEAFDWYVLTVAPRREFTARERLAVEGLTALVPVVTEKPRVVSGSNFKRRVPDPVEHPMLPRYLLLAVGIDQLVNWVRLDQLDPQPRVIRWRSTGEPARIDPGSIARLLLHERLTAMMIRRAPANFRIGESVEIESDLFEGRVGRIDKIVPSGKPRARLVFDDGGPDMTVTLDKLRKRD